MARPKRPDRRRRTAARSHSFTVPRTVSHPALLQRGTDEAFRDTLYLMALAFGRLRAFREAFGRALSLTAPQFIVLIGAAYRQGEDGVSIRALAQHTQLADTHVTTEVGRLIAKRLLRKAVNQRDRRSMLVRLTPRGEAAIRRVTPLLRRVNDRLFENVSRDEFTVVSRFLATFAINSKIALVELEWVRRRRRARARMRGDRK